MTPPVTKPTLINPPDLATPRGYSHGVLAPAGHRLLALAGQIGWDREGRLQSGFGAQFTQALDNLMAVLRAAGGEAQHLLSLRLYVTDKHAYNAALREVGQAYRARLGRYFPAMALVQVAALLEDGALVEIEGLAALPPDPAQTPDPAQDRP